VTSSTGSKGSRPNGFTRCTAERSRKRHYPSYIRALREQRFAFEGTLLGRKVVPDDADVVTG